MTNLRDVVERYRKLAKKFGEPVSLAEFELSPSEAVGVFTAMDEDYHISRFLKFSLGDGKPYTIGGASVTHVQMEEGILSVL
jgi:hypothetical protein